MENCINEIAFPHFVMEREIKASDRSRVCLVRSKETGERYIYRAFTGSGEVYRKLLGIDCPYLPRVHEVKEENETVYVLEEYIQGDTLSFLLEGKPLSPSHAKQILIHTCHALKILHGIGAVHRDIKPENIILRGSDAVLIDFDASRLCKAENTVDTQIMGTTGYAAPEQYGFSQTDARTDIYALGILLNEMLTGQHPSKQLAEGDFRPIIEKCTRINADLRYASVAELIEAFNPPPQTRKHPIRYSLLLLLAFAILLGGGLLYRGFSARETPANTQETPAEAQKTEAVKIPKEPLSNLSEIDVFVREKHEITMEPWESSTEGYATPFKCDMDGDGENESYLFGVDYIDSPHENVVYYDRNLTFPNLHHIRNVHPCVWRIMDDGTMAVATEFAELLTDAQTKVWRVDDFVSSEPEAWTFDYIWPGCVTVNFCPEQDGMWLFDISAYLGDHKLTAIATTSFYFEEAEETTLPSAPNVYVQKTFDVTMDPWEGSTESHGTSFKCDLDGDGQSENYIFGLDYIESSHESIFYYDYCNSLVPGDHPYRQVYPCVWQKNANGSITEVATEFAGLLKNIELRIWRVDDFVSPRPSVRSYDYQWPGCVEVVFAPTQAGKWLYEVSATLDGQELTATAMSVFKFKK